MDAQSYFSKKKITIMGLGLLGRGVGDAKYLAECGSDIIVTDLDTKEALASSLAELATFPNIRYTLGKHDVRDFRGRDLILKGAGVPPDSPYITEAERRGIPVRMSADLFLERAGIQSIGVTGTRGKTTTTHLIHAILKEAGEKVILGGNIHGISTLALLPSVTPEHVAVLELDSWQLRGFGAMKLSPDIAVLTTFYPDHVRYYKNDMNAYLADKANIFLFQKPSGMFILGSQGAHAVENKYPAHVPRAIRADQHDISGWKLKIPGDHNRENAACAVGAARAFGIEESVIRHATESFSGVQGRLECIRELGGVKFYNDTAAVTPEAVRAGLHSFNGAPIILIMGGGDKGLSAETLVTEAQQRTKRIILLSGSGTDTIRERIPNAPVYETLDEAVRDAMTHAEQGDVVLLSPAFSSQNMFKNAYDRGEQFNAIVRGL